MYISISDTPTFSILEVKMWQLPCIICPLASLPKLLWEEVSEFRSIFNDVHRTCGKSSSIKYLYICRWLLHACKWLVLWYAVPFCLRIVGNKQHLHPSRTIFEPSPKTYLQRLVIEFVNSYEWLMFSSPNSELTDLVRNTMCIDVPPVCLASVSGYRTSLQFLPLESGLVASAILF